MKYISLWHKPIVKLGKKKRERGLRQRRAEAGRNGGTAQEGKGKSTIFELSNGLSHSEQ